MINTFLEVEKELIDVITELGYQKGRSNKFSVISAYIYTREEVTQAILRDLTGFSLATISNALNKLEENNTIRKEFRKDDRQYHYFLNGTLSAILGRNMGDIQIYFSKIDSKLDEIKEKLKEPSLQGKNGYENIEEFVNKMKILIPAFQNVMKKYQNAPPSS